MQIIGVDLHTRQQTVAMLNVETGEIVEKSPVAAFIGHVLFWGASHSPGLSSRSYLNALIAPQF